MKDKEDMTKEEMIWIASVALGKKWDSEQLRWSDYLYDKSKYFDEIWGYVEEGHENGMKWFREEYSAHKLY